MKLFARLITPMAIAVSLSLTAGTAVTHDFHMGAEGHPLKLLKQLDLTDQQRQDVRQLFKQGKEDFKVFHQDMKNAHQALRSLTQSREWDETAIRALLTQNQQLRDQLQLQKAIKKNQLWNTLTTEQQTKMTELRAQQHQSRMQHLPGSRMLKKLELDESQQAQVSALQEQMVLTREQNKESLTVLREARKALVTAETFDQEAWLSLAAENQDTFIDMAVSRAQFHHQLWNLLTPEQQQQAKAMEMKRRHKRERHMLKAGI